jgi:hypothetical protein
MRMRIRCLARPRPRPSRVRAGRNRSSCRSRGDKCCDERLGFTRAVSVAELAVPSTAAPVASPPSAPRTERSAARPDEPRRSPCQCDSLMTSAWAHVTGPASTSPKTSATNTVGHRSPPAPRAATPFTWRQRRQPPHRRPRHPDALQCRSTAANLQHALSSLLRSLGHWPGLRGVSGMLPPPLIARGSL